MCMRTDTIVKKLDRLAEIQRQIDELSYEADEIKEQMKKELESRGEEELVAGPWKVVYKSVFSSRFDSTAFKRDNPSLYGKYLKESVSKRFSVK